MTGNTSKPIDQKTFWRALGERPIGVTIVAARGMSGPAGFMALSAAHVSADPPTMLVSIDRRTSALAAVFESRAFSVNFLPTAAVHVAEAFGGKSGVTGGERFRDGEWTTLATGSPVYGAALGAFDCRVEDIVQRGDISIVIGTVVDLVAAGTGDPLVFFRGKLRGDTSLG